MIILEYKTMFERSLPAVSRFGRHHIAVESYKASTLKVDCI